MEAAGQRSSMSNLQQAAHRAVEVMNAHMMRADTDEFYEAKEALRKALVDADDTSQERVDEKAKREQEPVAWISEGGDVSRSKRYMDEMGFKCNPLYTAPPKREWVGLTDDAVFELADTNLYEGGKNYGVLAFAKAVEQALKEKNT